MRVETFLMNLEADQYSGMGQETTSLGALSAAARRLEEQGWDGAVMPEAGQDPFLPLMVAAEHTRRMRLGTNVAIAFPRSPMVTAQIAWDLQRYSGGRFQLGLGTQVKGHNERRYSAPWTAAPGPRLREYLQCLQAIFATFRNPRQPMYFRGEHYQFTLITPFFNPGPIEHSQVPVYIAAVNKFMARLGGELADGLRIHPFATFRYVREILRPETEAGAQKAARPLSATDIVGAPFLAVGANEAEVEAAKNGLRPRIAFYGSTRTYHSVLRFHGWEDVGLALHDLSLKGKWLDMAKLITDEMLEEFAIIAKYDDLVPKLEKRCRGIFDTVTLDLPPGLRRDDDRVRGIVRELRASSGSTSGSGSSR